jgi:hypothetical protein
MSIGEDLSKAPRAVRIAGILGLPDATNMTDAALARRVASGLPRSRPPGSRQLKVFGKLVFGTGDVMSKEESERIYEMSRVMDAALQAYGGDRDLAEEFLRRPHQLLDGEVPLELAKVSSAGADAVVALIGRAVAGVAV